MGYYAQRYMTIPLPGASSNPGDAEVLYLSDYLAALSTSESVRRIHLNTTGRVIAVHVSFWASGGVVGTNENIVCDLWKNNATAYSVATVGTTDIRRYFTNLHMSVPIEPGDYFSIRFTCPTWVTNPASIICNGYALVEYP
jgi:hypothetical protein